MLDIEKRKLKFGIMVETVRAAMTAGPLAEIVEFFSFGTNDLTQATLSFSREDAEKKFLPEYLKLGILKENPFEVLDKDGVVKVMDIAVKGGRASNPKLEIGVCGEQGGEPHIYPLCQRYRSQLCELQSVPDSGSQTGGCPDSSKAESEQSSRKVFILSHADENQSHCPPFGRG